jgi:maltose alpha-D-glucosyltransferase/alpha-amylase
LAFAAEEAASDIRAKRAEVVVAEVRLEQRNSASVSGVLYDASQDAAFGQVLLDAIWRHKRFRKAGGEFRAFALGRFQHAANVAQASEFERQHVSPACDGDFGSHMAVAAFKGRQRHSSILFRDRFVLKLYRCIEEGVNSELEVGVYLTDKSKSAHVAPIAGSLEYRRGWGAPLTVGVLHEFIPHHEDGWRYVRDSLDFYFERARVRSETPEDLPLPRSPLAMLTGRVVPPLAQEMIGPPLEALRVLGTNAGELHLALAAVNDDPSFAPEPFTTLLQRSMYQSVRSQIRRAFEVLRRCKPQDSDRRAQIATLLAKEESLLLRVRPIYARPLSGQRVRIHGDFQLREVLYDGRTFSFIDFEGDVSRPLSARRRKYSPLRDVATMLRSFHNAVLVSLRDGTIRREDRPELEPWARFWLTRASASFLGAYLDIAHRGHFLPDKAEDRDTLLDFYLVKRAVTELWTELSRGLNPDSDDWNRIGLPIEGLLELLDESQ